QAEAAADRRAQRHHRHAPRILELPRRDGVVVGVRQHAKTFGDELLRRLESLLRVREQRLRIGEHLQLDQRVFAAELQLPREPAGAHRVLGGEAARGVRQQHHVLGKPVQERGLALRLQIEPAHRDGDHLRAARLERRLHGGKVPVLAGADHEPRSEAVAAQNQLVHIQPPPTKVTISSTSPEASLCSPWRAFFTTSPLRSTATRSPRPPRSCSSAYTVSPSGSSIVSPLTVACMSRVLGPRPGGVKQRLSRWTRWARLGNPPGASLDNTDLLRQVSIFRELPQQTLADLAGRVWHKQAEAGSVIVSQEEAGDALFVIASGKVKVVLYG